MIYRLEYKKVIVLLTIGFIVLMGCLWYKGLTTNKQVPKRASFVLNTIEWGKDNG